MKTFFGAVLLALATTSAFAQDITGTWRYIDDKTGEPKGLVKIEKQPNGTYAGTVLKITPRPGYTPKEFCTAILTVKLVISQFNLNPIICKFFGISTPGLAR